MNDRVRRGSVLITGTSTGIGRATALRLDELGYRVFAGVRREEDGEDLRRLGSSELTPVVLDVTDRESIDDARRQVEVALDDSGLAGLVNNAGVGVSGPMELVPMEKIRWVFDVNYFGAIEVTRAFLPYVRKSRGRIVNISSTATLATLPFHGPYTSSKLALNGFSEALRLELREQGIQVSVIICGSVRTPIWDKGRSIAEAIWSEYPPIYDELYRASHKTLGAFFAKIARDGVAPEQAAAVITRAITDPRPRNTYMVGPDAYSNLVLTSLIRGKLRERLLLRIIGLRAKALLPG